MHREMHTRKNTFILLALAFFILLGFPLITIADKHRFFGPFPALFAYVFIVWLVVIIALWLTVTAKTGRDHKHE